MGLRFVRHSVTLVLKQSSCFRYQSRQRMDEGSRHKETSWEALTVRFEVLKTRTRIVDETVGEK